MLQYLFYVLLRFELLMGKNTLLELYLYNAKVLQIPSLLKFPYYHVMTSPLYYHGPLILVLSESE
jgi:hypothetical protein